MDNPPTTPEAASQPDPWEPTDDDIEYVLFSDARYWALEADAQDEQYEEVRPSWIWR